MKKHLSLLLTCLLLCSFAAADSPLVYGQQNEAKVYVCTGPKAKRYHSRKCSGVKNCSSEIILISKQEAKKRGYTPCKICYK